MSGMVMKRNCRNVWFKEFWTKHFNCTFREMTEGNRKECTGEEPISTEQEGLVPFVGEEGLRKMGNGVFNETYVFSY